MTYDGGTPAAFEIGKVYTAHWTISRLGFFEANEDEDDHTFTLLLRGSTGRVANGYLEDNHYRCSDEIYEKNTQPAVAATPRDAAPAPPAECVALESQWAGMHAEPLVASLCGKGPQANECQCHTARVDVISHLRDLALEHARRARELHRVRGAALNQQAAGRSVLERTLLSDAAGRATSAAHSTRDTTTRIDSCNSDTTTRVDSCSGVMSPRGPSRPHRAAHARMRRATRGATRREVPGRE